MRRETDLTIEEKGKITDVSLAGASSRAFAGAFEQRKSVVQNYLKSPAQYGIRKVLGDDEK